MRHECVWKYETFVAGRPYFLAIIMLCDDFAFDAAVIVF